MYSYVMICILHFGRYSSGCVCIDTDPSLSVLECFGMYSMYCKYEYVSTSICMYRNNHVYVLYVVVCIDTFASIDWYRFTIHTNTLHTTIHANTFTWGEKTVSLTDPVLVCIWYVSRYVVACNGMYLAG